MADGPEIAGVGRGDEDCGRFWYDSYCNGGYNGGKCGRPFVAKKSCMKRTCPNCYKKWRWERVEKALERMAALDMHQHLEDGGRVHEWQDLGELRWVHLEVSFKEHQHGELPTDEEMKEARRRASDVAKEAGMKGMMVIPHHYRIRPEVKDDLRDEGYGDGSGLWEGVREDALGYGTWRAYVTPGLHFHIIGTSGFAWTSEAQLKSGDQVGGDDTVMKRIRDIRGKGDLIAAISYVSDHATPPSGSHYASWTGCLSYRKFSPERNLSTYELSRLRELLTKGLQEDDDEDDEECPCCGSKERRSIYMAGDLLDSNHDVHHSLPLMRAYNFTVHRDSVDDPPDDTDRAELESWVFRDVAESETSDFLAPHERDEFQERGYDL